MNNDRPKAPHTPVAIVGLGCRFPKAPDADAFWSLIDRGEATFSDIPKERWNHEVFYSPVQRDTDKAWVAKGSFIEEFKEFAALHYGIAPRRLEVMDPQQRLLIESTRWALQDAGYERTSFDRKRTGVFFGVSVSEFKNVAQSRVHAMQLAGGDFGPPAGDQPLRDAIMDLSAQVVPMRAFHLSGSLTALAAASVAQTFDLRGPAYIIDSACASASVAVNDAMMHLRTGRLDYAVAGGVYLNLTPDNLVAFTKIGAISPEGICRPFDHRASGFVQSDGVGVLVLRRLDDAIRDGDRIHAVLIGSGCNNDGRGEGPMTPRFEGQVDVLRAAYEDAGVSPASVAYFEAHGTATSIGDPVEVRALGTVLAESGRADPALVGSVKGNIGHAMSAAGIAGLVKAIKVLEHRVAPPQPGYEKPHEKLELDKYPLQVSSERAPLEPVPGHPLRVAVSSFGFGGTNSHLILEAPPAAERPKRVSEPIEVAIERGAATPEVEPEALLVTAPTPELLAQHLETLEQHLAGEAGAHISLADLAFTLNVRRDRERYRAVVGAKTPVELFRNLRATAAALDGQAKFPLQVSPHAVVYDVGAREDFVAPKVAFLFPGQGAQRTGLLAGLNRRFSTFEQTLARFEAGLDGILDRPLRSYLYPEVDSEDAQAALTQTEVCQPAMAALGLALGELLSKTGVEAHVSLGHSLGEFAALAYGGVLEPAQAVRLVARRGAAIRDLKLDDPGRMAAVMTDEATVRDLIRDVEGVVVANINHPRQVSISGTSAGVEAASERLTAAGHDVRQLDVSHAFHSPVLNGIDDKVKALVAATSIGAPRHIVASCIAGEVYTADAERTRGVLGRHATSAVQFVRGLRQAQEAGATVFVQVGAGSTLVSFARASLSRDIKTLTLAPAVDDGGYELVRGLCTLAALGVEVDMEPLYAGESRQVVTLPETPLERQSYWVIKSQPQPVAELNHSLPGPSMPRVLTAAAPPAPAPVNDGGEPAAEQTAAPASAPPAEPTAGLVALFQQQAEVLRAHAEVLAAQNRALLGQTGVNEATASAPGAVPATTPTAPPPAAPAPAVKAIPQPSVQAPPADAPVAAPTPSAPAAPEPKAPALDEEAVRDEVLAIISKVSAFPQDSLRSEQRLVDELGFDSLMVADLGGAIESKFPSAGSLPPTLFSLETTVGDIAGHLVQTLHRNQSTGPTEAKDEPKAVRSPARRYRVVPTAQARLEGPAHDVDGETWLVTEDDSKLSLELSARLAELGARVIRVRFSKDGVAAPARIAFGTVNLWPEAFVEGLPEALTTAGVQIDGFIHAAGMAPAAGTGSGPAHPITLLHPLAAKLSVARMAVVTSLGGNLGLERSPILSRNVLQAAAIGYAKALGRERPNSVVRALDIDPRVDPKRLAGWLVEELLSPDLSLEVGFNGGQRLIPELVPVDQAAAATRKLGSQDVVLITGGAGEIGARVAKWAASHKPKGVIIAGRRGPTDEINRLLDELSKQGCTAAYVSVDVTEPGSLEGATRVFVDRVGKVTVVLHAAGVIEDAPADQKSLESVERVMATKVRGAQSILQGFPELRDLIFFSSWAGRFGNAGQVDYSASNELLDRLAVASSGTTRMVSIDWPPWLGTQMVDSIPAPIRQAMESRGVTFLEPKEGIELLEQVFSEEARGIELVGRDLPTREIRGRRRERFGLDQHPYLQDHRLNGRPVVPLASVTDWVSRTFESALPTGSSTGDGHPVAGPLLLEDMQLGRGVMGEEVAELRIDGEIREDGLASATFEVRAGKDMGLAYRGRIRTATAVEVSAVELSGQPRTAPLTLDDFYRAHTFHGPMLRGIRKLNRTTSDGITGLIRPAVAGEWMTGPGADKHWSLDPLILDGSFQLAGYWLHVQEGKAGFPVGFGRLTRLRPFGKESVHCVVRLNNIDDKGFSGDLWYADAEGRPYALMEDIRGHFADLEASGDATAPRPAAKAGEKTNAARKVPARRTEAEERSTTPATTVARSIRAPAGTNGAGNGALHGVPEPTPVDVPDDTWDVAKFPEVEALAQRFEMAKLMGLHNPYFAVHAGTARDTSVIEGKELIHFSGYNYLGFSGRDEVVRAAQDAATRYGTSVSASRVASGERPIHQDFEQGIADHLGVESAILYVGGHTTNVTTIGHIIDKDDIVIHDSLIHDSIFQGIKLSGAARRPFPHNDMDALDRMLGQIRTSFRRVLLCVEGIYSMDGDICDLPRAIELKKKYRCLLLVDEAHSIGVLGHQGRGVGHHFEGIDPTDVDMWMGTLSKSFASVGGYIAGRKALIEYLKYTAPGFVYSVGLAPPNAAAALEALHLMQKEPEVVERLRSNSVFFLQECKRRGLDTGPAVGAAVVPVIVGDSMRCMKLSAVLKDKGINVQPIVYPAVDNESARLRFFISALHSEEQLRYAAQATHESLEALMRDESEGGQPRV